MLDQIVIFIENYQDKLDSRVKLIKLDDYKINLNKLNKEYNDKTFDLVSNKVNKNQIKCNQFEQKVVELQSVCVQCVVY